MAALCRNMNIVMKSRMFHQRGARTAEAITQGHQTSHFSRIIQRLPWPSIKIKINKHSKVHAKFPSQQAQVQHLLTHLNCKLHGCGHMKFHPPEEVVVVVVGRERVGVWQAG